MPDDGSRVTGETMEHVFRIENAKGEGPYRAHGMFDNWGQGATCFGSRAEELQEIEGYGGFQKPNWGNPFPNIDGMGCEPNFPDGVFGYESLKALQAWWLAENDITSLKEEGGFHVVEYIPAKVQKGVHQLYFTKGRKVRTLTWKEAGLDAT